MSRVALTCDLPVWRGTAAEPVQDLHLRQFTLIESATGLLSQVVKESEAAAQYAEDDYAFITPPPGTSAWATSVSAPYLAFLRECVNIDGKVLFDIGAGSTYFAEELTSGPNSAASAIVVDPAVSPSPSHRVQVVRDWWQESTSQRHGLPDPNLIVSSNCLEHVPDVPHFLSACRTALAPKNGDLILIFPDVASQLSMGDWNSLLHEHVSYFTMETARALFASIGFTEVRAHSEYDTFYFHLRSGPVMGVQPADIPAFDPHPFSTVLGSFSHAAQTAVPGRPRQLALVGATNGLNNVLSLTGECFGEGLFVYDSDDFKVGRYLPALKDPIRHVTDSRLRDAYTVIIAAMTFFEDIRSRLVNELGVADSRIQPLCPRA